MGVGSPVRLAGLASVVASATLATASAATIAPLTHRWPGDLAGRLASLATLQSLEIELLTRDSATVTLDDWCARHRIAAPGSRIVADRESGTRKEPTPEQRRLLGVSAQEPVEYRRVRLRCGTHILSEADNWYVPSRLTPQMNAALAGTNTPFGRVVAPLRFHRQTLAARLLWAPLPAGWDSGTALPAADAPLDIPEHVIENQALLVTSAGVPISIVTETYTRGVLDFPPPTRGR